jgi:hypothetical protein
LPSLFGDFKTLDRKSRYQLLDFSGFENMSTQTIELAPLPSNAAVDRPSDGLSDDNFQPDHDVSSTLPRPDTGKDAWLFLTACVSPEKE